MMKNEEPSLGDVVLQLQINNRLLAAQLTKSETFKSHDLIVLIASTGAQHKVIAGIMNMTPDAVRKVLEREHAKESHTKKSEDGPDSGK